MKKYLLFSIFLVWNLIEVHNSQSRNLPDFNNSNNHLDYSKLSDIKHDSVKYILSQLRIPEVAVAWCKAGMESEIPDYKNIVQPILSIDKDAGESNVNLLQQSIDMAFPGTVILLDTGVYHFSGDIKMKSGIVLRGRGNEFTRLCFEKLSPAYRGAINFTGMHGRGTPITSGLEQGSSRIKVADNYGIPSGATIMLTQLNDSAWMNTDNPQDWDQPWADRAVGQMVKVVDAKHQVFELNDPVRYHDYKYSLDPKYYFITKKVELAGIEDLTIEMCADLSDAGRFTIQFNLAENCWIMGVKLINAHRGHLNIMHGRNILVEENIFQGAQASGRGAGVDIGLRTSNCLVTGNLFSNLKQSIILQTGSNANVIANNKITENDSANPCISVRGHWTYLNLFENNEADVIAVGNLYGPAGEGTTLFRNKIKKKISIEDRSYNINIIGNEIGNEGEIYVDPEIIEPFLLQNKISGSPQVRQVIDNVGIPGSLYKF